LPNFFGSDEIQTRRYCPHLGSSNSKFVVTMNFLESIGNESCRYFCEYVDIYFLVQNFGGE
jgi:hypothetical protein